MAHKEDFDFGNCGKYYKDAKIVCEENGQRFEGSNIKKQEILYVTVDLNGINCLGFKGEVCDFLIINIKSEKAFFVELKGKNIRKAVSQLENSIRQICNPMNKFIKKKLEKRNAYAILSKYPRGDKNITRYKELLRKNLNTSLYIKNRVIKENLE